MAGLEPTNRLKRLLYLGYYMRRMNWTLLARFMRHARQTYGMSYPRQIREFIGASLHFNISPMEYYQFGFPELDRVERTEWAGTGTMYEFQRRMNPPGARDVLADKRAFFQAYREFFQHSLWSLAELEADPALGSRVLSEHEKLVFKDATGNCGTSVRIETSQNLAGASVAQYMTRNGFDLVESYVEQHEDLNRLSPSAVNTVRIFTLIDEDGDCRVLGCRLRISVDSHVDNLAAGNLAAPIDESTGIVDGPGIYSDVTRQPEVRHPVTGTEIVGFRVPYWQETLQLAIRAASHRPENRSVGWDVVVTPAGPGLIEGNHDWCKLVWQLPVRRGLKAKLE